MKEKNYKEQEQDKTRGKKKYRERLVQEREAEQEIKEFDRSSSIEDDLQILQARKTNRSISS